MSNLRKLYLPNELGDLCFSLHISSHHNVENNREKFKENLTTTSITKESPEVLGQKSRVWLIHETIDLRESKLAFCCRKLN